MARYGMIIDIDKCNGCYNCFLACKDEFEGNDYAPFSLSQPSSGKSWMGIMEKERGVFPKVKLDYIPLPCLQCSEATCVNAAVNGEVYRRPDGIVIIDPEKSKGQKDIQFNCPHRVIQWNEEKNGWFYTGDIAKMDEDGNLIITDRKKDIIVLANGKNVAPQPVENMLKDSHLISQVILIGDGRSTISALIVPSYENLGVWIKEQGIEINSEDKKEISCNPEVNSLIRGEIQRRTGNLAEFEKIRAFTLVDHEFTVENGEITPTLKVKRNVILEKYKDVIEAMYR